MSESVVDCHGVSLQRLERPFIEGGLERGQHSSTGSNSGECAGTQESEVDGGRSLRSGRLPDDAEHHDHVPTEFTT